MKAAAFPGGGGFVMVGSGKFAPSEENKALVVRVDESGEVQWSVRMEDTLEA